MGREVRRVPKDWQHPKNDRGGYQPLCDGDTYNNRVNAWLTDLKEKGLQWALDYWGNPPSADDYMPVWTDAEADHLMMYENTSAGTPISPAFKTAEDLARWLADNNASAFGGMRATYEQWLAMIHDGYAPSMAVIGGRAMSGVAMAEVRKHDGHQD